MTYNLEITDGQNQIDYHEATSHPPPREGEYIYVHHYGFCRITEVQHVMEENVHSVTVDTGPTPPIVGDDEPPQTPPLGPIKRWVLDNEQFFAVEVGSEETAEQMAREIQAEIAESVPEDGDRRKPRCPFCITESLEHRQYAASGLPSPVMDCPECDFSYDPT